MEAKLTIKPMIIEDIVTIAYGDEIAAENKLKERMNRKLERAAIAGFFIIFDKWKNQRMHVLY